MDLKRRIAEAFAKNGLDQNVANEIAFHMTDFEEDLKELLKLFQNEEEFNDEEIRRMIIKFLAHVPNHAAAAKKLVGLGPIEDIFNVGVCEEED